MMLKREEIIDENSRVKSIEHYLRESITTNVPYCIGTYEFGTTNGETVRIDFLDTYYYRIDDSRKRIIKKNYDADLFGITSDAFIQQLIYLNELRSIGLEFYDSHNDEFNICNLKTIEIIIYIADIPELDGFENNYLKINKDKSGLYAVNLKNKLIKNCKFEKL